MDFHHGRLEHLSESVVPAREPTGVAVNAEAKEADSEVQVDHRSPLRGS